MHVTACHLGSLDEDYMGAHEAKQKILEQEQMLQAHMDIFGRFQENIGNCEICQSFALSIRSPAKALRVEGTPTPGRAPAWLPKVV